MVSKTFNIWRDLFRNIDKKLKIDFYFVTFLMIISGLSECFSIASIVPFNTVRPIFLPNCFTAFGGNCCQFDSVNQLGQCL